MSSLKNLGNGHSSEGQEERLVHGMKHVDIEIWLTTGVRSRNDGGYWQDRNADN